VRDGLPLATTTMTGGAPIRSRNLLPPAGCCGWRRAWAASSRSRWTARSGATAAIA